MAIIQSFPSKIINFIISFLRETSHSSPTFIFFSFPKPETEKETPSSRPKRLPHSAVV